RRRRAGNLAHQQLGVADDLDTRRIGLVDGPVGRGMGERHARAEHQRGEAVERCRREVLDRQPRGCGGVTGVWPVVPADRFGAAGDQRRHRRPPAPRQSEYRNLPPGECRSRNHGDYLSLSVASPMSASTTAMIQKRTMIVGSFQPFCSKWWCSGAIRKMRLPVSLNDTTWTITDT